MSSDVRPDAEETRLRTTAILAAAFSAALAIGLAVCTVAADAKTSARYHRHWRTPHNVNVGYGFGTWIATGVAGPAVPAATSPLFAQGVFEYYPGPGYRDYGYYTYHRALKSHTR
jgi:hypothetical protein